MKKIIAIAFLFLVSLVLFACDTTPNYTFEIKFKSTELYKNGTVMECLDSNWHGMRITDNEVIFSPYSDIRLVNNETQLRSRLTRNEWHTITFVILPKNASTTNNFYHSYFYKNLYYN